MEDPKLENKADTPAVDRRTKGEIIEACKKDIEVKDVEIEALKKKIAELDEVVEAKDKHISNYEITKRKDDPLLDVEYIKECCGIEIGFIQQMNYADATMMEQKGYVKISD